MSYDAIAAELGITQAQARWIFRAALRKLRKACRRYGIEPGDVIGRPVSNFAQSETWS